MTELEKLERARMYMEKLSEGIDPISDLPLPKVYADSERLSRCFVYVSEVLDKLIRNGGEVGQKSSVKKSDFMVTEELLAQLTPSNVPLRISDFEKRINSAPACENMKVLRSNAFTTWLVHKGYLQNEVSPEGKLKRTLTASSQSIGIYGESRMSQNNYEYTAVYYTPKAQQFLIDHLHEIAEYYQALPSKYRKPDRPASLTPAYDGDK